MQPQTPRLAGKVAIIIGAGQQPGETLGNGLQFGHALAGRGRAKVLPLPGARQTALFDRGNEYAQRRQVHHHVLRL